MLYGEKRRAWLRLGGDIHDTHLSPKACPTISSTKYGVVVSLVHGPPPLLSGYPAASPPVAGQSSSGAEALLTPHSDTLVNWPGCVERGIHPLFTIAWAMGGKKQDADRYSRVDAPLSPTNDPALAAELRLLPARRALFMVLVAVTVATLLWA
ncbi:MAG: hypothetical protein ACJ8H8_13660, partial [Geminicoccaceae bacterium]